MDEVQSRYLEAFLLNCDARFPPAAIGNVYLWKKVCINQSTKIRARPSPTPYHSIHPIQPTSPQKQIYKDLRPLGSRLARGRPGDARDAEDIKLFISDAHATYEAYIHPPPPSSSTGSSSGGATPRGGESGSSRRSNIIPCIC